MTRKVAILQNITREGPGLLLNVLEAQSVPYTLHDLSQGDPIPDVDSFLAVIILGGPDSANDNTPKIRQELQLVRQVLNRQIPYLGICLGMQLLVKAGGGKVLPCHTPEIGFRNGNGQFYRVQLTQPGRQDTLFSGVSRTFPIFHLHGETVELTTGMQLLGIGNDCPVQLVKVGIKAYGIQGHVEITETMLKLWLEEDPDLIRLGNPEGILQDFRALKSELHTAGERIFRNFLTMINP